MLKFLREAATLEEVCVELLINSLTGQTLVLCHVFILKEKKLPFKHGMGIGVE